MEYLVIAEIEIDGNLIEHFSSVYLKQKFNEHHEFAIRLNYDILDTSGSLTMNKAQEKIGKTVLIRLVKITDSNEVAYEFLGVVCEVRLENSGRSNSDLVIAGYSPTILLETGENLSSFYKSDLKKIIDKIAKPLSDFNCQVNFNNEYKKPITYVCQYKESAFHFINRLSNDYSEFFYYDGQNVQFGKPAKGESLEIAYGEEINTMQLALKLQPMTFKNYAYLSKDDKVIDCDAPSAVNGLGQYASYVLNESNAFFSEPVNIPVKQRVEDKSELQKFAEKRKAAMAANLEILTATSINPAICIGGTINLKISRLQDNDFVREDYGEYLITSIEHYISDNARYYNSFEAIPASAEVIPVTNIIHPIAEPQIATVKDNKDPGNMGRVRVQMLWQKDDNMTDWIRVMTPDAGGGKDGAKNRGLVVVPEPGDQVVLGFRYNDPDRPFVLGSMFHGKTGGGGGQGNNSKSLTSKSGHVITLDDGKGINIIDKSGGNKIEIDGTNLITITASQKIELTNGKAAITMDGDTITITAAHVNIGGSADCYLNGGENGFAAAAGGDVSVNGKDVSVSGSKTAVVSGTSEATLTGGKATVNGDSEATLNGGGKTTVSAGGKVAVQGAIVALN